MSKLKFTTRADLYLTDGRIEIESARDGKSATVYIHQGDQIGASFLVYADDLRQVVAMCDRMAQELERNGIEGDDE